MRDSYKAISIFWPFHTKASLFTVLVMVAGILHLNDQEAQRKERKKKKNLALCLVLLPVPLARLGLVVVVHSEIASKFWSEILRNLDLKSSAFEPDSLGGRVPRMAWRKRRNGQTGE